MNTVLHYCFVNDTLAYIVLLLSSFSLSESAESCKTQSKTASPKKSGNRPDPFSQFYKRKPFAPS